MKIVAIVGSPRPEGNTSYLVDEALDEARKQGLDTEKVVLVEHPFGWCESHVECGTRPDCLHVHDAATDIIERLFSADGVILSTSVQMGNVSGPMKNFMDRTRFKRRLKTKMPARSIGLIAVASSSGIDDTLAILERYAGGQSDMPKEKMHKLGGKAGKPGEAKANPELAKQARDLGKKMAEEIKQKAG
jgi:multimeric flavodoxin WrbA